MYAVRYYEYGSPEVLHYEDCAAPRPRAGQVLVEVEAAGVNPLDWRIRSGENLPGDYRSLPAVPGTDFAGRVTAVGPGVRQFIVGDRVFGQCELSAQGAYAEQITVGCNRLALVPRGLSMARAASLPTIGLAAWHALFEFGELRPGQQVLIAGAAGCVGVLAAQLARLVDDVRVVGLCQRGRHSAVDGLYSELLDTACDAAALRGRFDLVLNLLGPAFECAAIAAARRGGGMVTASPMPDFARCWARSVRGIGLSGRFSREHLESVARLVLAGTVNTPQLRIEPLAEAAAMHELGERQLLRGKAILLPG